MQRPDLRHGFGATNGGQHAAVGIAKWPAIGRRLNMFDDAGQRGSVLSNTMGAVADHEDPRIAWNGQIWLNFDTT